MKFENRQNQQIVKKIRARVGFVREERRGNWEEKWGFVS